MKQQLCMVCVNNTVWENGSRYCWNCLNSRQTFINEFARFQKVK